MLFSSFILTAIFEYKKQFVFISFWTKCAIFHEIFYKPSPCLVRKKAGNSNQNLTYAATLLFRNVTLYWRLKNVKSFIETDFVKIHLCTEQAPQTQQPPAQASATSSNFLAIKSALSKRRNSPTTLGLNSELSKRRGSPAGNETYLLKFSQTNDKRPWPQGSFRVTPKYDR